MRSSAASRPGAIAASLGMVFVLLFLAENLLDGFEFFRELGYQLTRRDVTTPRFNASVYAGAYLLGLAGLAVLYGHAWRGLRLVAYVLSVATLTTFLGFGAVNGYGFTYHEASLVWSETSFVGDALTFFLGSYWLPLVLAVSGAVLFERFVVPRLTTTRSLLLLLVPLVAVPVNAVLLQRTHSKVYQLPIPYRIPMLLHYAYRFRTLHLAPRDAPYLDVSGPPLADHIVMVVDESVRGDLLGLNGAPYDTTPRLAALSGAVFNYGVASALSNLSSTSNIMLQSGLRPDQVPDRELRSLKNPSLFAYMRHAGFAPYFIDGQIYSDKPTNFMTRYDLDELAGRFQVRREHPGLPEHQMDLAALERIAEIVESQPRSFVYLLKTGAHFPYEDKYPDEERVHRPTLPLGAVTPGRVETLNSYLNALRWAVDAFLMRTVERLEATGRNVLVVYTSDHGQSLLEPGPDGQPFRGFPHATPLDPPVEQALVPLMLIAVGERVREALALRYLPELTDRVSSFEIFPTLLVAAGFDPGEVRARYHTSLFDPEARSEARFFVSGNLFEQGRPYQNQLVRRVSRAYRNPFEPPLRRAT
ncbi:MAG: sulfatase-like hydrolase/transferase, partial [Myxococcota bacterium]